MYDGPCVCLRDDDGELYDECCCYTGDDCCSCPLILDQIQAPHPKRRGWLRRWYMHGRYM